MEEEKAEDRRRKQEEEEGWRGRSRSSSALQAGLGLRRLLTSGWRDVRLRGREASWVAGGGEVEE
ncbi:hypothetical protein HPP92_028863 [Vanilla planifolia]|uniref:Uncharacterized protein n=1 Tax=Vanilla planifolia TaxID=51239 RepID=A0A835P3U3_VANPL|nr:hypothetical protein HPP92_028863 [Vanilla planifolia]KAG0446396.1 hypothetical protein HPP92_028852 [Vanilla planifolia]